MKVSYVLFLLIKGFYLKTIIGFFITNIEQFGHVDVILDREHVDFQKKNASIFSFKYVRSDNNNTKVQQVKLKSVLYVLLILPV